MMLERMSPSEVVFAVETAGGEQFDVLVDIQYDTHAGFHYNASYFRPHSTDRIRKSSFPVSMQLELSALVDREYRSYMRFAEPEVEAYLSSDESVAI